MAAERRAHSGRPRRDARRAQGRQVKAAQKGLGAQWGVVMGCGTSGAAGRAVPAWSGRGGLERAARRHPMSSDGDSAAETHMGAPRRASGRCAGGPRRGRGVGGGAGSLTAPCVAVWRERCGCGGTRWRRLGDCRCGPSATDSLALGALPVRSTGGRPAGAVLNAV